jgi:hypothetical protein
VTVRAVIVGIERYDQDDWNVPAPAVNAVAVARWVLRSGVQPDDVLLFVSPLDPEITKDLSETGVKVHGATFRDIDTALRIQLPRAEPGSNLLFYWSGHGMTDRIGQRLFFCSDYTTVLADRVFNASLFFRKLRSDIFANYRRMLALADVCGTNSRAPVEPAVYDPGPPSKRDHLIYFATPEGGYARAETGEAAFTHAVLQALDRFVSFPDFNLFKDRLEVALKALSLPRFLLDTKSETGESQGYFGIATMSPDSIANSLIELLVDLRVPRADLQTHFLATVVALKNPRLFAAEGLTGMVRELSELRDPDPGATHGLVQFVLRLCTYPKLKGKLENWLALWAVESTVDDEQANLEAEQGRNLLILDMEVDARDQIVVLRPSLRSLDQIKLRGRPLDPVPVRTWRDVENAVLAVLRQLETDGFTRDLEIHVVVEANVFHRPFHRLPSLKAGIKLGEKFAVVLHHRERTVPGVSAAKRRWLKRVKAVSSREPAGLTWTRCAQVPHLPRDPCLCLASGPTSAQGKLALGKLIDLGAPFIYWPHSEDEPDAHEDLTNLVRDLETLEDMPEALLGKRIIDRATSGSLLWDVLSFKPYG